MSFVTQPVRVRVPATSANLGPGFDSLGIALTMYDEIEAEVAPAGLEITVTGESADQVRTDEANLVHRSMQAAFELLGVRPAGLRLRSYNTIPHGRGMGSSSAAIIGGIILARALVEGGEERLDYRTILQLANDIEGHPDNVAPALHGGLTISRIAGGAAETLRLDVTSEVTVFIPPTPVATKVARDLLPETVSHEDAAANAGRAALLIAALLHAPQELIYATEDRLHQSYRSEAMPDSYRLMQQMRVHGIPAVISGAGPTVLAFASGISDWTPEGWQVRELAIEPRGAHVL